MSTFIIGTETLNIGQNFPFEKMIDKSDNLFDIPPNDYEACITVSNVDAFVLA